MTKKLTTLLVLALALFNAELALANPQNTSHYHRRVQSTHTEAATTNQTPQAQQKHYSEPYSTHSQKQTVSPHSYFETCNDTCHEQCHQTYCEPCDPEPVYYCYKPRYNYCRPEGWYARFSGSIDCHRDMLLNSPDCKEDFEFDTGFDVSASIGYSYNSCRFEFEIHYQDNEFDHSSVTTSTGSSNQGVDGCVSDVALMVNAYYDLNFHRYFGLYAGVGIGVDFHHLEIHPYTASTVTFTNKTDQHEALFAWQAMAGLNFFLNDCASFFAGYRFFASSDVNGVKREKSGSTVTASVDDFPYSHNLEFGIRFHF